MKHLMGAWTIPAAALVLALAGCGGGGGASGSAPFGGGTGTGAGTGGGTTGGTTTTNNLTVELRLFNQAGAVTNNILAGQPVRAQAILRKNGTAVANELVRFSVTDGSTLIKIDPVTGTQLTDASGVATVTVSTVGTESGAGRIKVESAVGTATGTASANFFASGSTTSQPATLTLSGLEISSSTVSAYGTTGLRVRVLQGAAPYTSGAVTVNFTSSCAAGKATITPTATTQSDGYAVATFVDNGCAQTSDNVVTITASISTDAKSAAVTVRSPSTGSLRFVSVSPSDKSITLRGQGGNGRQENATLTFRLVDVAGQGVGDVDVCFDSTTYIGGLNIDGFSSFALPAQRGSQALCGADNLSLARYVKRTNADGSVSLQVNSGTVPTPVRVRARALYPAGAAQQLLESFSDTLSVSTGLPMQRSFSLSIDKANIDGGNFDGEEAILTARLADQFSNPVPDGTVVNFIASGGAVCTADNGSCRTTNGACSCRFVSQARRPLDNRVVVTAYAIGLEDYDDNNGDNIYRQGDDGFTADKDLGDAYVDANKDGQPSSSTLNGDTDILVPYQNGNTFRAAGDGVRGTAHIRASTVIYLSRSSSAGAPTLLIPSSSLSRRHDLRTGSQSDSFIRLDPGCPDGTPLPQASFTGFLDDGSGNPMASGTGLALVQPTENVNALALRPASVLAIGARPPSPLFDLPNTVKGVSMPGTSGIVQSGHAITIRGVLDKCAGNGNVALQVTSPRGGPTTAGIVYQGEDRSAARGTLNVSYVASALSVSVTLAQKRASIQAYWVGRPNDVVSLGAITFCDTSGTDPAPPVPDQNSWSCTYTSIGQRTIEVTATVNGAPRTGQVTVNVP